MAPTRASHSYDLVVLGSGGAAFAAAIRATKLGAHVAIVERGRLGGTCVNVGCVPSKALLAAADAYHTAGHHHFRGVTTRTGPVDIAALVAQKDDLVADLRKTRYQDVAGEHGFDVIEGTARFTAPDRLEVDGRPLTARAYVMATGVEPAVPDLPGLADVPYLTSTTAMELEELPARLVVVGGGFVGMEMSQLFARLGTEVQLVGRLARDTEPELAEWMRRIFTDEGIVVRETRATAVTRTRDGNGNGRRITVRGADGTTSVGDAVLIATGRRVRAGELGLDAAVIERDERGFVLVDPGQRTSNPRIWASGDVTGGPQFVYSAAAQGAVAAENALRSVDGSEPPRTPQTVDYAGLPSVVFTSPQLAGAGLTEAEALAAGHSCDCRVLELEHVPRALVNRDTRGAVKIVAAADTHRMLGVHAVAEGAGDLMLAATYAIKFGLTVEQLADTWAPYLTTSEALRLAAQSFTVDVRSLSCCAA